MASSQALYILLSTFLFVERKQEIACMIVLLQNNSLNKQDMLRHKKETSRRQLSSQISWFGSLRVRTTETKGTT